MTQKMVFSLLASLWFQIAALAQSPAGQKHVRDGVEDLPIHLLLVEEGAFAAVGSVRHFFMIAEGPGGIVP